ncbi:MAG: hypothetical protein C0418_04495 [Coriobacteriaceae bacterium]|nr:hypothetical protein [Coriobacteriaceae bacterium]
MRLVNNWLHDFSSGLWGSCVLVLWLLERSLPDTPPDEAVASVLFGIQWVFWWILLAALAIIALTGAVRLFYWRSATPAEELPAKRPALIGKHIAFLGIYGLGTWWAWTLL